MTLAEFKAWLDGFNNGVGDAPTKEQWHLIQEKISEIRENYIPNLPVYPSVPSDDFWNGRQKRPVRPLDIWFAEPSASDHVHVAPYTVVSSGSPN